MWFVLGKGKRDRSGLFRPHHANVERKKRSNVGWELEGGKLSTPKDE